VKFAVVLAVAVLALSGCSKKPKPTPATAEQKPGEAPAENVVGEVNAFLTEQLRIFIREKGRLPESFAELARVRLDSVPRSPEGKKWVIDTATKEVKAVASQ
jgi:hypothetical protein